MTLTSDFPCARVGCEQGAEVSCVTCPYGPTMTEVKPPSTPAMESLSPTILSAELSAFHDSHRLNFVMYARDRGALREEAEDVVHNAFLTLYRVGEAFLVADNQDGFALIGSSPSDGSPAGSRHQMSTDTPKGRPPDITFSRPLPGPAAPTGPAPERGADVREWGRRREGGGPRRIRASYGYRPVVGSGGS